MGQLVALDANEANLALRSVLAVMAISHEHSSFHAPNDHVC
jgi:hypothetical protein